MSNFTHGSFHLIIVFLLPDNLIIFIFPELEPLSLNIRVFILLCKINSMITQDQLKDLSGRELALRRHL